MSEELKKDFLIYFSNYLRLSTGKCSEKKLSQYLRLYEKNVENPLKEKFDSFNSIFDFDNTADLNNFLLHAKEVLPSMAVLLLDKWPQEREKRTRSYEPWTMIRHYRAFLDMLTNFHQLAISVTPLPKEEDESETAKVQIRKQTSLRDIYVGAQQVIYYGAPGTGKSYRTDKLVEGDRQNEFHQRTTFHPDSDYSSFVGCYKPTKEDGELTYKFVPQAFLKSYIAAWKNLEHPYYLIIEEINRGNCAQVFGDIFQLLDRREDGFSKYHITPDTDIAAYLQDDAFAGITADDMPAIEGIETEQILSGEIMQLPGNLHIYATMNTSDQSLFPIDSAFKRRWEWEYRPIEQPNGAQYCDWKIVTDDGAAYDWWVFLTKVNNRIFETTQSEDKKMGYWFTKADEHKRITQKQFIGKVLFYLWNDVFKDYARTEDSVFKVFKDTDKKETEEYTFTDFFRSEGVTDRVHRLMFTLGVAREEWVDSAKLDIDDKDIGNNDVEWVAPTFTVNGGTAKNMIQTVLTVLQLYFENNPEISTETAISEWNNIGLPKHALETEEEFTARTDVSKTRATDIFVATDGRKFYVSNQLRKQHMERLIPKAKSWGIEVIKVS